MSRVVVDRDNVNDEVVVVRKLYKRDGDRAVADEPVLEIETSKTVTEIRSPSTGVLRMSVAEGEEIAVGALLFEVNDATPQQEEQASADADGRDSVRGPERQHLVGGDREFEPRLSLAATALAARLGVNIQSIPSRGWITSQDVLAFASPDAQYSARGSVPPALQADTEVSAAKPFTAFRTQRNSLRKRNEARNLKAGNPSGAVSTIGIELKVSTFRLVQPPFLFEDGITDLVVFEASRLLRRYPELNAFHVDERTVGYFDSVNFGVSFDSGGNLKVLALRAADTKTLPEIQAGIQSLLELYESGAPLDEELLAGSTVTVSDLSRAPAGFMLPLLNARQSLIIGITAPRRNEFALYASFDHRISEGLQVARFLGELRERVLSHFRPEVAQPRYEQLRCCVCDQSMQAEQEIGGRALLRVVQPDGTEGLLCRNCFKGW